MDEETIRKEREKEDERHAAVIKKHESILVDTMKKLIEFRKGIPVRELAIDMLWDEKAGEINANLLRRLNHDFNEGFANFNLNGYPNELLYKDRTMRSVDELIEEYLNTQKIPNLFDYWLW
ncbi:unnamed protein product, partial [Mesorhabditis belari]|uniref:Uncharacterized protein n=1 Tax=Mesorhabditis belari TaxID=2138241 RepID=A0AAF3F4I0_9BILA